MSNKPVQQTKKPFVSNEKNTYVIQVPENGGTVTITNVTKLWVNDVGVAIFYEENMRVKYTCPCECYDSISLKGDKDIVVVTNNKS